MPRIIDNEKGYVFTPLLVFSVFAALLFVYISFIFPAFQNNSKISGSTSIPKVEDGSMPSLTLSCTGLGLKDGWCQATRIVSTDGSHSYTLLYPKNFSAKATDTPTNSLIFEDTNGKVDYSVTVKMLTGSQRATISRSTYSAFVDTGDKVMSTQDIKVGKNEIPATEVSTSSARGQKIYYIFNVPVGQETYLYLLKFDSDLDESIIEEVSSTFSVAVL